MNYRKNAAAPRPAAEDTPPASDRITVALIPQAAKDLALLQQDTGLGKTDITNRAISLYAFLQEQIQDGRDLILRDQETGETQLVKFL